MALAHGSDVVVKLGANDISAFTNNSEPESEADEHDVTCYGSDDHIIEPGLKKGKTTIGGVYKTGATGPGTYVEAFVGTKQTLVVQLEGTGSGKPQKSVLVHVKSYKETAPVADYVRWAAELTFSGPVTRTPQA